MQSSISVKVQLNSQFRRFALSSRSYEELVKQIRSMFSVSDALDLKVQYEDDEGDKITISSDPELVTATNTMASRCLKLFAITVQKPVLLKNESVTNAPAPKEEKKPKAERPLKSKMPDFVREIIKRKQIEKSESIDADVDADKTKRTVYRVRLLAPRDALDCKELAQEAPFIKTWKLRNVGTLPWPADCKLIRVSKDMTMMSAVDSVAITREVAPGDDYEVSIPMRAPNQPGSYESLWRMADKDGNRFGPRVSCKINVLAPKSVQKPEIKEELIAAPTNEKRSIAERRQARQERLTKYEAQLNKLRELGFKPNGRHIKLLVQNDGDVDRVVTFLAQKKERASS